MLIINGTLITWEKENRILEDYGVYIQDGLIVEIGPSAELVRRYPDDHQVDARGQLVMPGNICAHTHFYGAFSRGMAIPGLAPRNFPEILNKLWWPLDLALDEEAVRYSALVMLVDAIRHGTTTLIDHHASPNFIDGSLDVIADAVRQAGVRGSLCYEVTDRNGIDGAKAGIRENVRFLKARSKSKKRSGSLIRGSFGLHASLTVSDTTLEDCAAAMPEGAGIHVHVAEDVTDEYDSLSKSGLRVVDRLEKFGLLGSNAIAVHAVHVDAMEMKILADSGTWVTHQPRSNMNNAVGMPRVEEMLRMGIQVCLGTDGFSSTMWEEWKAAYLVHKLWNKDPQRMNGMDVIQMGVYNNAALARMFYPEALLGAITPGAYADLIFVDYHPYTPMTSGNLPWQILFGFNESMVTTTIVAGKVLMQNRKLLTLDEEKIAAEASALAPKIWKRYEGFVGTY
ncbi:MAG: putative aminohydrolase SsnA [Anaerolineales bacterium]|nr:putative aminohydrolase SsnA [Anaerolineales bacterium]